MAKRPLPDQALLLKLLRYEPETGKLYWRERPVEMFKAGGNKTTAAVAQGWNTKNACKEALAAHTPDGYRFGSIFGRPYLAHRVIWKIVTGSDPDQIDHINGIRSDNRFCNLRSVQEGENQKNCAIPSTNKSGVMGVYWSDERQRWCATIRQNGKRMGLGRYKTIDEAVRVRKAAERKFGFHPNHGRAPQ